MELGLVKCEDEKASVPSSVEQKPEENQGCVEGVLVEIESSDTTMKGSVDVCLAEDKGEEQDLFV